LRPGDVVVVWKLDRLSRKLADLIAIIQLFHRQGASFRSLTESISTSGPMGEFTLHILGAVAQFERALIRERTKAGLARARTAGRVGGRRPTFTDAQIRAAKELRASGASWKDAANSIGISLTRLQARIRDLCQTN
jgi:DNA invertase Pin-like site-specific DNA recombinase